MWSFQLFGQVQKLSLKKVFLPTKLKTRKQKFENQLFCNPG